MARGTQIHQPYAYVLSIIRGSLCINPTSMYFLLSEVQEMEQTLPHGCRIHFDDANKLYQFTLTISKSASFGVQSHDANPSVSIFIVYTRSFQEGNVFSRVCLSFCLFFCGRIIRTTVSRILVVVLFLLMVLCLYLQPRMTGTGTGESTAST